MKKHSFIHKKLFFIYIPAFFNNTIRHYLKPAALFTLYNYAQSPIFICPSSIILITFQPFNLSPFSYFRLLFNCFHFHSFSFILLIYPFQSHLTARLFTQFQLFFYLPYHQSPHCVYITGYDVCNKEGEKGRKRRAKEKEKRKERKERKEG